jgi:hypothetical protein
MILKKSICEDKYLLFDDAGQLLVIRGSELSTVALMLWRAQEGTVEAPRRWGRLLPSPMALPTP